MWWSKKDVVKKYIYNDKIKNIEDKTPGIPNLATNTTIYTKTNEVKNKVPGITNLATTNALNAKVNEVKNKMSNITNLANTIVLTNVENKIPVSNLLQKTDYNTKIREIKLLLIMIMIDILLLKNLIS